MQGAVSLRAMKTNQDVPNHLFSDKVRRTDMQRDRTDKHGADPPGIEPGRGCAVFFRLIQLSVLLTLSERKERI